MAERFRVLKKTAETIFTTISRYDLIQPGDNVLVALSGGPDSVFLLHFLLQFRRRFKINIAAAHFNHQLRGNDSDRDQKFCENLCLKLNVPLLVKSYDAAAYAKKNKLSLEEAGRELRYTYFQELADERGFSKIATAHTINDNAESVLLNILKGTGLNGLSGIAPKLNGNIIRPLIHTSKIEILASLKSNKIPYRIDKSNKDNDFLRNYCRNELMPRIKMKINPKADESLLRLSRSVAQYQQLISELFLNPMIDTFILKNANGWEIRIAKLNDLPEFILSAFFHQFITTRLERQTTQKEIENFISLMTKPVGSSFILPQSMKAVLERDSIRILTAPDEKEKQIPIVVGVSIDVAGLIISVKNIPMKKNHLNSDPTIEYIDADKIEGEMTLRTWKAGDHFFPIGMNRRKKISDFLTDEKTPVTLKKHQLVLSDAKKILWVVGKRLDERVKLTSQTKRVLELRVKKNG